MFLPILKSCFYPNTKTQFQSSHIPNPVPCSLLPLLSASGALGCWSSADISPERQPSSYSPRWLCSSSSPPLSPRPPAVLHLTQTCHPACSCRRPSSPSSVESREHKWWRWEMNCQEVGGGGRWRCGKKKEWKHKREMVSNVQDHQKKRSYICKLTRAQYKRFVFIK